MRSIEKFSHIYTSNFVLFANYMLSIWDTKNVEEYFQEFEKFFHPQ